MTSRISTLSKKHFKNTLIVFAVSTGYNLCANISRILIEKRIEDTITWTGHILGFAKVTLSVTLFAAILALLLSYLSDLIEKRFNLDKKYASIIKSLVFSFPILYTIDALAFIGGYGFWHPFIVVPYSLNETIKEFGVLILFIALLTFMYQLFKEKKSTKTKK